MSLIVGIDPGSRCTGFGIIRQQGGRISYVASGCIRTTHENFPQRLHQIYLDLNEVIESYRPDEAAIEQVFLGKSVSSAFKLGQARGAALVALSSQGLSVAEYSARQIKQSIVGRGAAEKQQIQHMVCQLLGLGAQPPEDAADGLAVALCHAYQRKALARVPGMEKIRQGRVQ